MRIILSLVRSPYLMDLSGLRALSGEESSRREDRFLKSVVDCH